MATRIAVKLVTCLSSTALLFILTKPPHFHTLGRQTLQEPSRVRGGCSVPPEQPQCEEDAYTPTTPRGEPPTREGSTASPGAGPNRGPRSPLRPASQRRQPLALPGCHGDQRGRAQCSKAPVDWLRGRVQSAGGVLRRCQDGGQVNTARRNAGVGVMAGGGEGCAGLEGSGVSAAVPLSGLEWRSAPSAALASPAYRLPRAAASPRPPPRPPGVGGGPPRPAVPSRAQREGGGEGRRLGCPGKRWPGRAGRAHPPPLGRGGRRSLQYHP